MNRRNFVIGTAAVAGIAALGRYEVSAQEAEATPDVFRYDFEGTFVTAARNFESAGLRMEGAMKYGFGVGIWEDEEYAKKSWDSRDDYMEKYFEETSNRADSEMVWGEVREMSAPDIGDESEAYAVTVTAGDFDFEMIILWAMKDKTIHRVMGVGFLAPAEEMFSIVDEHVKFEDVDTDNDEEVFALLPDLDDMPDGFLLATDGAGEIIERHEG